jgi:hypothetical protein
MKTLILTISILFIGIQTFAQTPIISVDPDSLSENLFFARASTQTLTISNNGNSDLIYQIKPTILPRENYQNYALQFDGVDDYVDVFEGGVLQGLGNDNFTLSAWIYPESYNTGSIIRNDHDYNLFLNEDNQLQAEAFKSSVFNYETGNSSLLINSWYHVATVWNGSDLKIYINGILDQSIMSSQYFNIYPAPLWIGRSPYYDQPFQGLIDEVCIWNVALTQQQIQLSMNHQLTGIEQGLVGYWRFDEGSGDIVFDKTVNGNNGILNGGTQWVASSAPVEPYFWIMVNPDSGVVAPGSFVDLAANFNTAGLISGDYNAELVITSNDPVSPELIIPVSLTITDAPAIHTETHSIDFGEIFLGVTDTFYLEVKNIGSQDLLIFSAVIQPNEYSVYPTFAGIDPGDSEIFTIWFLPQTVGNYPGDLTFSSNDPVFSNYIINISGQGVEPPVILFSPDSIFAEVLQGQTITNTLTISNLGGSNLYFDISGSSNSNNFALQFDGMNDIVVGSAEGFPTGNSDRTIELWFKRISQPFEEGILMAYGGWGWNNADELYVMGIHQSDWWFSQWGGGVNGNTVIQSNQWYHSAVVNVGNDVLLYLNGEEDGYGNLNINTSLDDTSYYMGKAPPGFDENRRFNGVIDEVRIWNVARTQQEIQQSMYQELDGSEQGLVGYWKFNEGMGDIANDLTINANHGSLQGGALWTNSSAPLTPSWLSINPDSGVCSPNSFIKMEVLLDATELDSGDFYGSLIIDSNDPVNPSISIPVHLKVEAVVGVDNELNVPNVYELYQNYPNPFNPTTTIKYAIPKTSKVSLALFTILGEEMATLVNEEKTAGNYEVEFNASNLPSGVYFYRLQADSFIETKKMLLLK